MMEHIIKSLEGKELATALTLLGLAREVRLWHLGVLKEKRLSRQHKK